jgi:hypothetical protein
MNLDVEQLDENNPVEYGSHTGSKGFCLAGIS